MEKKALPIYIFSFFMIMPLHAILPVLPLIRDELQASYSEISFFVASIGIIRLLLSFPSGYLVDRFDKKKMMLFSGCMSVTGLLLMSFSHSIYQLIFSRILIGTSSILCTITILVVLAELAGENSKAMMMSMNNVIHNAGGIVAPVFAGFLSGRYNWRLPFIVNAAFIVLSMAVIFLTVPALNTTASDIKKDPSGKKNKFIPAGFRAEIIRLIPVFGVAVFVFFYRSAFRHNLIPFYAKDVFQISTEALGFYISLTGMVAMISIFVSGHLADRFGRKVVVMPAVSLSGLAAAALLLPVGWNPLLLTSILVGMGAIINSMPNILITDIASPGSVGKLIGINRIFADSGYLIGSVAAGMMLDYFGFVVPVLVVAGFAAFTLGLTVLYIPKR